MLPAIAITKLDRTRSTVEFRIAGTFTDSVANLNSVEQNPRHATVLCWKTRTSLSSIVP